MILAAAMAAYQLGTNLQMAKITQGNARLASRVAEFNADAEDLDAFHAEADGYTESARYAETSNAIISDQRVALAARGVAVDSGIGKDIQNESKLNSFLNTLDIQNQAHAKALGYQNQARNTRLNSILQSAQSAQVASAQQSAGITQAGGTLLSGYQRDGSGTGKSSQKVNAEGYLHYDYDTNKTNFFQNA